ncbi:MAG TPA: glycerol-3-phosphate dehydrogenase/oxidase [Solirubrobacteraceae bacterium]|nr:glycerol-3-phosphate dehydrogenase/oxidase [Solirubrobacteraceae bacterium]
MIPRADALESLERDNFDLVVVGGGITGAGVALDAASRGYSVALVEKSDFSAGTSSRSSKLVHGGLRYLQNFDLGLVREALLERSLLVKLAPHLVTPLPMIVPTFEGKRPDRVLGVGLNMYDVMSWRRGRPPQRKLGLRGGVLDENEEWSPERHRIVDGPEVAELIPALADRDPSAGYLFYDCQTDDSRLVLTVLGEAERFGTVIANRSEVTGLVERGGRAAGVLVRDAAGGGEFELIAANVVNATGVWADRLRPQELYEEEEVPRIRPSRGTHFTLPRELLDVRVGVIVPAGGGRTVFVLPWLGRTLVGTTDNDYEGSVEHVPPGDEDVAYLLEAVNEFFGTRLGPDDLSGAYAGVRPLISTGDPKKSVDISRKAELYETSSGLVTITGGKLTTWRRMAKLAVDRIVEREGREAPCRTEEIQLGEPVDAGTLPEVAGVDEDSRAHLASRYGHAAQLVLRLAAADPELARRLSPDLPDIAAEAAFAADHEQACTVADVLLRRTRLGLLDARRLCVPGSAGVAAVARALAGQLGWDDGRTEREIADWHEVARAEGLVPHAAAAVPARGGGDGAAVPDGGAAPPEPSPTAPGAAPEEAA